MDAAPQTPPPTKCKVPENVKERRLSEIIARESVTDGMSVDARHRLLIASRTLKERLDGLAGPDGHLNNAL